MDDPELKKIFKSFWDNMGLDMRDINLEMLVDPEFYVAAFKHLFPNFEILIDEDPVQQVIETLSSEILDLDLSHIKGEKIMMGNIRHIKHLLSLLTDIAKIYSDSQSEVSKESLNANSGMEKVTSMFEDEDDEDEENQFRFAEAEEEMTEDDIYEEGEESEELYEGSYAEETLTPEGEPEEASEYSMEEDEDKVSAFSGEVEEFSEYSTYSDQGQIDEVSECTGESSVARSRPSIPKLPIREEGQNASALVKSSESNPASLGTVIRHDTPTKKAKTKITESPYIKPSNSRPQSAVVKPTSKFSSANLRDEITMITNLASNDIIKSIYSLVTTKNKMLHVKEMDNHDQQEIQTFFQEQKRKFRTQLEQHITKKEISQNQKDKRERLKEINRKKAARSSEIKEKAQLDELKRAQLSRENMKEVYEHKLKKRIKTVLNKHEKMHKVEKTKVKKEVQESHLKEKQLIIQNIQNYYRDKIDILRDQIKDEKKTRKVIEREQKKQMSQNRQTRTAIRKKQLAEAKDLIELESQKMRMEWVNAAQFEEKLLKLYKRSKRK